jgi:hypothetical protein
MSELCPAPQDAGVPGDASQIVSILVACDHPLLKLKQALDWEKMQDLMVAHWRQAGKNVSSGPGRAWPVSLYVPLLVLMSVKALNSRQMEEYLAENVVARLFLDLPDQLLPQIRDHSSIARAQAALGVVGWREVNQLVVREAVRLGFGHPEQLSSDTTVQEPQIGYPHEAGILRGIAQRVLRALVKLAGGGEQLAQTAISQARQILKSVKHYHLFAQKKEDKDALLKEMVWQMVDLLYAVAEVRRHCKDTASRVTQAAVTTLQQMEEVSTHLLPQIAQWVTTGVVAQAKILHAGITEARAIVKNKVGKKVEFGLKWLINRIGGGYVFGDVVAAHSDEKKMPIEALQQYREVIGAAATPQMLVYDRGGSCGKTTDRLSKEGVQKVGIQPAGRAAWLVGEPDQQEVRSERARVEGSIGTLKNKKYSFQQRTERSNETLKAAGQRALVSMNLTKLLRDIVAKEKKVGETPA